MIPMRHLERVHIRQQVLVSRTESRGTSVERTVDPQIDQSRTQDSIKPTTDNEHTALIDFLAGGRERILVTENRHASKKTKRKTSVQKH